jgi:hypothetical protein
MLNNIREGLTSADSSEVSGSTKAAFSSVAERLLAYQVKLCTKEMFGGFVYFKQAMIDTFRITTTSLK